MRTFRSKYNTYFLVNFIHFAPVLYLPLNNNRFTFKWDIPVCECYTSSGHFKIIPLAMLLTIPRDGSGLMNSNLVPLLVRISTVSLFSSLLYPEPDQYVTLFRPPIYFREFKQLQTSFESTQL